MWLLLFVCLAIYLLVLRHKVVEDIFKLKQLFQEQEGTQLAIESFEWKVKMVDEFLQNLFSDWVTNVPIFLIDLLSVFIERQAVVWLWIKCQLDKNPNILFYLFLHKTTWIHKNGLYSFLPILFWNKWVTKLINSFGHTDTITFLFDNWFFGIECHYFCLLYIALDWLLLVGL